MNKIVAVVVTYNRKELLEENIKALLDQEFDQFDILIVDNASTDGTEKVVKKYESKKLKYMNTGANLGGAGGFNFGLRQAIEKNYDYCWLMDDDTIPTKTALKSLVNKTEILKGEFSFLGSLVKWTDEKSICGMNVQIIHPEWLQEYEKMDNRLINVERNSFVSCYVNLKIAQQVGLPITKFFIYGDDWEYTIRLGKVKKGYLDLDSIVIHKMKENVTADIVTIPKERVKRCYYNFRNTFYISKKLGAIEVIKFPLIYIMWVIRVIAKSKNARLKRIWALTKGFFVGIFFNPKIEFAEPKENLEN